MARHKITNLHSADLNTNGNGPKLPSKDQIEYGEIAVNYLKDNERISIKNSDDEIITFVPQKSLSDYANLNGNNTFNGDNTFKNNIILENGIGSSKGDASVTKVWNTKGSTTDLSDYAKTAEVTTALATKANSSDVFTKTEVTTKLSDYAKLNGDNTFSGTNTFNGEIKLSNNNGIKSSNGDNKHVWNTNGDTNYIGDYSRFLAPNNLLINLGSLRYWKNVMHSDYNGLSPYTINLLPIDNDKWCYAPMVGSYVGGSFTLSFQNTGGESSTLTPLTIEIYGDNQGFWGTDAEEYLNTGKLTQVFSLSTNNATEYTSESDIQKNVLYFVSSTNTYFVRFDEPHARTHNLVFRWKGNNVNGVLTRVTLINSDVHIPTTDDPLAFYDRIISDRIKALEDKIDQLEKLVPNT